MSKEFLKRHIKATEEEIDVIESTHKGTVGRIYELKKRVNGVKKQAMMLIAICNPKTGRLVVSREEIKEVALQ